LRQVVGPGSQAGTAGWAALFAQPTERAHSLFGDSAPAPTPPTSSPCLSQRPTRPPPPGPRLAASGWLPACAGMTCRGDGCAREGKAVRLPCHTAIPGSKTRRAEMIA